VIGTDCTCSCKSNYQKITTTTASSVIRVWLHSICKCVNDLHIFYMIACPISGPHMIRSINILILFAVEAAMLDGWWGSFDTYPNDYIAQVWFKLTKGFQWVSDEWLLFVTQNEQFVSYDMARKS